MSKNKIENLFVKNHSKIWILCYKILILHLVKTIADFLTDAAARSKASAGRLNRRFPIED